jgi:hypothetical protein
MIELSLKVNGIRTSIRGREDGMQRIFVVPEDVLLAREIVREVTEGKPPN